MQDLGKQINQAPAARTAQRLRRTLNPSSPGVVQGYFLHTPGANEAALVDFKAQQKRAGSPDFLKADKSGPYMRTRQTMPQVRVSQDGNLAIENTDLTHRQAKVFFADPGVVADSNARLLEHGSPYRLRVDQASALTLNTALPDPVFNGKQLDRVTPSESPTNQGTSMSLTADYCNQVSEEIAQSGSLAQQAKVLGKDTQIPLGGEEYRVAEYIANRKAGDSHQQAVAKLGTGVAAVQRDAVGQTYIETAVPAITTGKEIEAHLQTVGINYWAPLDLALGQYLALRNAGNAHGAALVPLQGANLTAPQIQSVDTAYNNAKIPEVAAVILANTTVEAAASRSDPLTRLPPVTIDLFKSYVQRRVEGLSAVAAFRAANLGDPDQFANFFAVVDRHYTQGLNAAAGFGAARLRNALKDASPDLGLEYRIEPYVRARHGGALHRAALAQLPGGRPPAPVTRRALSQAYTAVVSAYPQPPAQMAQSLQTALQDLGVNQFAAPEVGQIFGSSMTGKVDDSGRVMDYRTGKPKNASREGWSSHYAAVAAKSGGDSITLENYARLAENANPLDAAKKEYYFQMYGSQQGQSWHESWTTAGRPVMNAVTTVYGNDKQTIWKGQLDAIPAPAGHVQVPNYTASLAAAKLAIDQAATPAQRKAAYYQGLSGLILASLQAHRQAADQSGHKPTLVPAHLTAIAANSLGADVATVDGELTTWVTFYQGRLANASRWDPLKRHRLTHKINKLQAIQTKLNDLRQYLEQRHV